MRKFFHRFIAALIFASIFGNSVFAEIKFGATTTVPSQAPNSPPKNNNDKPQRLDCTQPTTDPRCRPSQPYYYPYQTRPRPVIINELPAEPAIDTNALTDDWEGCRKAKLAAMAARDKGDSEQANRLDEWLWKNCRSYSYELRQLEQNDM